MAIDKSCLETENQADIDTLNWGSCTQSIFEAAYSANSLCTDRKATIACSANLPDINTGTVPLGTIIYADDIGVPIMAGCRVWKGLDGRTYRKDVPDTILFGWGCNSTGELGTNNVINASSPVQEVSSSINWCDITSGRSSVGIKTNGTLWGWGCGSFGLIGDAFQFNRCSPVQEASSSTNWSNTSTFNFHTAAIKTDSTLWSWGYNFAGQVGVNTLICTSVSSPIQEITSSTWQMVSAGYDHSLSIKNDGTLWGWGCNNRFQLGNGVSTNASSPVQEASSFTDWCLAAGGCRSSIGITTSGKLYGWGCGSFGQLGTNCANNLTSPVQEISSSTNWNCAVTAIHTLATKTDGTLWTWGYNVYGQLGINSDVSFSSPVQEITSSTNWCNISVHQFHSVGIKTSGELYSWGIGTSGVLGDGNSTGNQSSPVQEISSSTNWCVSAVGRVHTTAIKQVV